MNKHDDGVPRALAQVTRELAKEPTPELDFDAMEERLMAKVEAEPMLAAPRRRGAPVIWAVSAIAAAAAIVLLFRSAAPASSALSPDEPQAVRVAPKKAPASPRDHIQTGAEARSFSKAGLADWTLEANSEADVADEGERITVHLARGAIRVEVVPQPVKERFVVIADDTRVAVHGTRFRVARAEAVQVDVEHGVVAVGALVGEAAFVLKAPAGGTFALHGGGGELRSLAPFTEPKALVIAPTEPRSTPLATVAKTAEPKPVKGLDEVTLRSRGAAAATECFQKNAKLAANVHVTVSTTLRLVTDAGGLVSGTFDPPLAPAVEACFRDAMGQLRGTPGTVDVPLSLVGRQ